MDMNNFANWNVETMKFHAAIDQLLKTIKDKIDKLPDQRDFTSMAATLKDVIDDIEKINNSWAKHNTEFDKIKNVIYELKRTFDMYKSTLDDLQTTNNNMLSQINCIVALVDLLNIEITNARIRLNQEMFTLTDFNEVIIMAKRLNERYNMWKGWKGKIAIVIGGVVGSGFLVKYVFYLIESIKGFFGG